MLKKVIYFGDRPDNKKNRPFSPGEPPDKGRHKSDWPRR